METTSLFVGSFADPSAGVAANPPTADDRYFEVTGVIIGTDVVTTSHGFRTVTDGLVTTGTTDGCGLGAIVCGAEVLAPKIFIAELSCCCTGCLGFGCCTGFRGCGLILNLVTLLTGGEE